MVTVPPRQPSVAAPGRAGDWWVGATRRTLASASAALLILVLLVLAGEWASGAVGPGLLAMDVVLGVGGSLVLPRLGSRGTAATLAAVAASAVSPAALPLAATATLWTARRRSLRVAFPVAVAGVAAVMVRELWRPSTGVAFGWWALLVAVGYAGLVGWGAWRRANVALVASLAERARRVEQDQAARVAEARQAERDRIAAEMHDVLAHRLTLLTTYAGALEYRAETPPDDLRQAVGVIRTSAHLALTDLRDVIGVLRDDPESDSTTTPRPVPTIDDVPALVQECREVGMEVVWDDETGGPDLAPAIGRTVYRVVQEALTNVRKHAPGAASDVRMLGQPGADLEVDVVNGPGRAAGSGPVPPGSGTGLVGLAERVEVAGGRLDHGATASGGYRVHATLPWRE